jgi:hypothetical protein
VSSVGKTEPIKERAIRVYLPSVAQKQRWHAAAEQSGVSLSKWVVQTVEDAMRSAEEPEWKPRKDLEEELQGLKKEVADPHDDLRQQNTIRENLEAELRRYRAEPFLAHEFEGVRHYDKALIQVLRSVRDLDGKPQPLVDIETLTRLGIDRPEEKPVKAISLQLTNLEAYGLVKATPQGLEVD